MDRLPLIALVAATCWSCTDNGSGGPAPSGRVNAVKATPTKAIDLDAFCDVRPPAGKRFAFPELSEQAPVIVGKWHWVNVWATWCKPCLEELPMLVAWHNELATFDLVFLSADKTDDALTAFRTSHPQTPTSLRITEPGSLESWFATIGLDRGATLPVHVFVSPDGSVACIRSGAIASGDRAAITSIMAGR